MKKLIIILALLLASASARAQPQYPAPTFSGINNVGGKLQYYCPTTGCIPGNHLGAYTVINTASIYDMISQETALGINFVANTGGNFAVWAPNTTFPKNQILLSNNIFWIALNAGTTGSSGGPAIPSGLPGDGSGGSPNQNDGSIVWGFYSAGINNGKEGLSIAVRAGAGSGSVWAQANDITIDPGRNNLNNFTANLELDTSNNAQDCPPGVCSVFGTWESSAGLSSPTAALYVTGYVAGWHHGLLIDGTKAIVDDAIHLSDSGKNGISISGNHSVKDLYISSSTPPIAFEIDGMHSTADMVFGSNSPVAVLLSGAHAVADFNDIGSGPVGVNVAGVHSTVSISTVNDSAPTALQAKAGQAVCFSSIGSCVTYSPINHQYVFTDENNVRIMTLSATTGNLVIKGSLIQNASP